VLADYLEQCTSCEEGGAVVKRVLGGDVEMSSNFPGLERITGDFETLAKIFCIYKGCPTLLGS
jgi:hypothetical protein